MNAQTPKIAMRAVEPLRSYAGNARRHSKTQINQIADSIKRFGFTNPVLISDDGKTVAGHGRVMAARQLGVERVPTVKLSHLTVEERRAYRPVKPATSKRELQTLSDALGYCEKRAISPTPPESPFPRHRKAVPDG